MGATSHLMNAERSRVAAIASGYFFFVCFILDYNSLSHISYLENLLTGKVGICFKYLTCCMPPKPRFPGDGLEIQVGR